MTLSHQEILRCSQEAANEKKMSVNVLPGEMAASCFSSFLLHDFIVPEMGGELPKDPLQEDLTRDGRFLKPSEGFLLKKGFRMSCKT